MRVLVAGAGAVGGYLGACLARAGEEVTLFARGAHLRAMQQNGLRIVSDHRSDGGAHSSDGDGDDTGFVVHPHVTGTLADAGSLDVIILGVKAHSLTQLAPQLKPLIGENTTVISTQNGVPWWYFQIGAGERTGMHLGRVDPGGVIGDSIDPRRVLGSIVYFSTDIREPGVIHHREGHRISLGEPDGTRTERARNIAEALIKGGLRAPVTTRLRSEIWVKLLGNAAFNPISALTGATLVQIARDPEVSALVRHIMGEVETVANKLGIELPVSIDQRIAGAEKIGEHKTSMLQDLEAGRPLELEAIVGAAIEIGGHLGVPMPHTRSVYACTRLLETVSRQKPAPKNAWPAAETPENTLPAAGR